MSKCPYCNKYPHTDDCIRAGKRICNTCYSPITFKQESYTVHRMNGTTAGYIHKECWK